jgi:hypothetical protein
MKHAVFCDVAPCGFVGATRHNIPQDGIINVLLV